MPLGIQPVEANAASLQTSLPHCDQQIAAEEVKGVIIAVEDDLRIKRVPKVAPCIGLYHYEVQFDLTKI